ncbi:hypothetical protein ILUMI_16741, partial [Ignelater luminosus]
IYLHTRNTLISGRWGLLVSLDLKANNGEDDNVEASAMPSLSDTGGISNISPCLDAFPIIPDLDLLLVVSKNPEVRAIALDEFLENPSIVVANNNLEIIDEDEDSDDSIKDKDYHYEPGETSDSDVNSALCKMKNLSVLDKRSVAGGHSKMSEEQRATKIPKKDTCNKCDSYQVKIQNITSNNKEKQNVTFEHNRHLEQTELARKQMNSDLKIATVEVMEKENFVSTSSIEKDITNRKKTTNDSKVNWLTIKELKVIKDKPYSIFYKTTYNDTQSYQEINIKKRGKGRPSSSSSNIFVQRLKILWPEGKSIAQAKADDLKSILHLIPVADHSFYTNIVDDTNIEEDIDGYNGELDFQIEIHSEENDSI